MSKLDDILKDVKNTAESLADNEGINMGVPKQQIKALMLELIGEDFYDYTPEDLYSGEYNFANKIKAELRQKVAGL